MSPFLVDQAISKPWKMIVKVMLTVVLVEGLIMVIFAAVPMPELNEYILALMDAALLGLFVAPAMYFFLLKPMRQQTISEEQARFVMFDELTGLPRRDLFRELVEHEMDIARREASSSLMFIIDPGDISNINQLFGYKAGDELIKQFGQRLKSIFRDSDIVSRLGGDEFAVFLPKSGMSHIHKLIEKLKLPLERPFLVGDVQIDITHAVGVGVFPDHADNANDLIRRASMARNRTKQNHLHFSIYDVEDESISHSRLEMFGHLRQAIKDDELVLYYQPKIEQLNQRVVGVEALVRWTGEHGQSPSVFIPLAEQTGLINEITRWVFKAAVDQCCAWRDLGLRIPVSVNVSSRSLYDSRMMDYLVRYVEKKALAHELITIEVTESAVMNHLEMALTLLTHLRNIGFKISVDDFGTGYSSLAYIKLLPATELKIDQSFIANILSEKKDAIVVQSTIGLAKDLELQVVAEGVENVDVQEKLQKFGCDIIQGFYYSRPLDADAYLIWHQQWNAELVQDDSSMLSGGMGNDVQGSCQSG